MENKEHEKVLDVVELFFSSLFIKNFFPLKSFVCTSFFVLCVSCLDSPVSNIYLYITKKNMMWVGKKLSNRRL